MRKSEPITQRETTLEERLSIVYRILINAYERDTGRDICDEIEALQPVNLPQEDQPM